ncbi:putative transposable element [Trichonephila clavipes]|nr:putative transposable element [Trichonephila clavipes]
MRLQKRKGTVDGYEWRCRSQSKDNRHEVVRSVRKGTWFSESKLAITIILRLTRYWFDKNMNEFVMNDLKVNKNMTKLIRHVAAILRSQVVNGDRYRAMITNFFIPELNNHDVQELWFQQEGATCHTARATIDLLKDKFGDRLISRFGPVNWPQDLVI